MAALWKLAALLIGLLAAVEAADSGAPIYTAESIANAAANIAAHYAPNTFLSIYGENLSFGTRAISADDIRGELPTVLPGTGVRVLINSTPVNIYYISPKQVNILVPPSYTPGRATLQLVRDSVAGPAISIMLGVSAPAFFSADGRTIIATHADGSVISEASPARRGETIVMYATGLGPTIPAALPNRLPQSAARVANASEFRVLLNGAAVDAARVHYAGLTPGFAGLFQINLQVPENAPTDPEIRVGYPAEISPAGRFLVLR